MITLEEILQKEKNNVNSIFLYHCQDMWYAYDRSAAHFATIFSGEKTFESSCLHNNKPIHYLMTTNSFILKGASSKYNLQITAQGDDMIVVNFTKHIAEFEGIKECRQSTLPC